MTTKASKLKLVECFEFKASEDDHRKHINGALNSLENISKDLIIVSEESDKIPANKSMLSIFSPAICRLLSPPDCASLTLILPDCSTSSIKHLLNIITNGFSLSSKVSFAEISNIISVASLLEIDLSKLSYDDVAPKGSVEKHNIGGDEISNPELEEETFNMEVNAVMEEIREQINEDNTAFIKVKQEKIEKENEQINDKPPIKSTPFQVKKEKVDETGDQPGKFLDIHTKCQICQKNESGLYALWKHYFNFHLYEELKVKFPHLIKENSCVTCQKKFSVEKTAFQHVGILHHKLNDILIAKNMMPLPTPKMKVASKPEDRSEAIQKTNFLSSVPQTKVISAKEDAVHKAQDIVEQPTAEVVENLNNEKDLSLEENGNILDKNTLSVTPFENRNAETIDPKIRKYLEPHEKVDILEGRKPLYPEEKKDSETARTSIETSLKQDIDNIETPVIKNSVDCNSRNASFEALIRKDESEEYSIRQNSPIMTLAGNVEPTINENETMPKSDEDASEFSKIRNIFSDDNYQTLSLRCQICEHKEDGGQIYKLWKHYFTSHLYKEIKTFFSHLIKDQLCDLCKAKFKSEKSAFQHLSIKHQKINELLAIKQMMPLPLARAMNKDNNSTTEDRSGSQESSPSNKNTRISSQELDPSNKNTAISSQELNLSKVNNGPSSQESNLPNKNNGASTHESISSIKMKKVSSQESNLANKSNLVPSQESIFSSNEAPSQESNLSVKSLGISFQSNEENNSEQQKLKRKTPFEAVKETLENNESNSSGTISKNINVKLQGSSSADLSRKRKSIGSVISGLKFKTPKIDEARYGQKERESTKTKTAPQEKGSFDELTCQLCSVQEINLTHIWRHYVDVHFKEAIQLSIQLSNCMQGNSCTACNVRKFANKSDMIRHYGLYHDKVNHLLKDSGMRQISQPKRMSMKKNKQVADSDDTNKSATNSMAIIREAHKEVDEQAENQIFNTPDVPKSKQGIGQDGVSKQFTEISNQFGKSPISKKFTEEEIFQLKKEYQKNKYITEEDREELAQRTGMDKKRILGWFSQKRKQEKKLSEKVLNVSSKRENEKNVRQKFIKEIKTTK